MPHTITMRPKKIIIKKGTSLLLQLFEIHLSSISSEQKSVLRISFDEKTQEGLPGSIKSKLEFVTGQKHGAKECFFENIECSLSDSANNIRKEYLVFLNNLMTKASITSEKTEGDVIESRYVLFYEILLRLLTVALSNEENAKREGYQFINTMESFIHTCIIHKDLNLNQLFCCELNEQHPDWVAQFRQAVAVIQLICLPENAFTALINYLDNIQKTLQAHLLAHSNSIEVSEDLSDQRINTTYTNFMNLNTHSLLTLDLLEELHPTQLEKYKNIKNKKSKEVVSPLFRILNQTNFLLNTVVKIENIIKASGWILLLTGKLRFDELIEYIKLHQKRCEHVLDASNKKIDKNGKLCKMLLRQGRLHGKAITNVVPSICQKLRQLGNIDEHKILIKQFATDVQGLLEDEKILGIRLIEKEKSLSIPQGQIQDYQKNLKPGQKNTLFLHTLTTPFEDPVVNILHHSSSPPDIIPNYTSEEKLEESPVLSTPTLKTPTASPSQPDITEHKEMTIFLHTLTTPFEDPVVNILHHSSSPPDIIPNYTSEEKLEEPPVLSTPTLKTPTPSPSQPDITEHKETTMEKPIENKTHNDSTALPTDAPMTSTSSSEAQIVNLDQHKTKTPDYIKLYFNGFVDKDYEATILSLWKITKFNEQTKMGGKGKPTHHQEIQSLGEDDFLYIFNYGKHLSTAGPLCKKITEIIQNFETQQMDYTRPNKFFPTLFKLDVLWEQRHYELFYLKYWCVSHSRQGADEGKLLGLIRTICIKSETKILSPYDDLIKDLKALVEDIDEGKGVCIPLQYSSPEKEVEEIHKKYEQEKSDNSEKIKELKAEIQTQKQETELKMETQKKEMESNMVKLLEEYLKQQNQSKNNPGNDTTNTNNTRSSPFFNKN